MCHTELQRVFELADLVKNRGAEGAYFQDFENSIRSEPEKMKVWLRREAELDELDEDAWQFLKDEATPYMSRPDPKRRWEQFISILNQARAYVYLKKDIGSSDLHFIPRRPKNKGRTPDLEGEIDGCKVLCEAKTINASDNEATARDSGAARAFTDKLTPGFFRKLRSHLDQAKKQMDEYCDAKAVRRIAFLVLNFDDRLAEYKACYYKQIDEYLSENPVECAEVLFYNQMTACHTCVSMVSATVVNEA